MRYQEPATMELSRKMRNALDDVLLSGVYTNGKYVELFEKEFKKMFRYSGECIAVSSCTSGLMLVLMKDSCLPQISDFTFSATAHSAYYACKQMKTADIDITTLNMAPTLHRMVDSVLATHIFGNPCDCKELERLTSQENVPLFFDGAHALGAEFDKKPIADYGLATVFSFSPTKLVTCGEGGMVVVNSREWAEDIRLMRNYGNEPDYDCYCPGLNARMTEFQAIVGLESLLTYQYRRKHRLNIVEEYNSHFGEDLLQRVQEGGTHAWKDYSLLLPPSKREAVQAALLNHGIESKRYFKPISDMVCYKRLAEPQPWAHSAYQRVLQLPLHDNMTEEDAKTISHIVLDTLWE